MSFKLVENCFCATRCSMEDIPSAISQARIIVAAGVPDVVINLNSFILYTNLFLKKY